MLTLRAVEWANGVDGSRQFAGVGSFALNERTKRYFKVLGPAMPTQVRRKVTQLVETMMFFGIAATIPTERL